MYENKLTVDLAADLGTLMDESFTSDIRALAHRWFRISSLEPAVLLEISSIISTTLLHRCQQEIIEQARLNPQDIGSLGQRVLEEASRLLLDAAYNDTEKLGTLAQYRVRATTPEEMAQLYADAFFLSGPQYNIHVPAEPLVYHLFQSESVLEGLFPDCGLLEPTVHRTMMHALKLYALPVLAAQKSFEIAWSKDFKQREKPCPIGELDMLVSSVGEYLALEHGSRTAVEALATALQESEQEVLNRWLGGTSAILYNGVSKSRDALFDAHTRDFAEKLRVHDRMVEKNGAAKAFLLGIHILTLRHPHFEIQEEEFAAQRGMARGFMTAYDDLADFAVSILDGSEHRSWQKFLDNTAPDVILEWWNNQKQLERDDKPSFVAQAPSDKEWGLREQERRSAFCYFVTDYLTRHFGETSVYLEYLATHHGQILKGSTEKEIKTLSEFASRVEDKALYGPLDRATYHVIQSIRLNPDHLTAEAELLETALGDKASEVCKAGIDYVKSRIAYYGDAKGWSEVCDVPHSVHRLALKNTIEHFRKMERLSGVKLPIKHTLQPVYDLLTTYSSLEDKPSGSGLRLGPLFVSIKAALGLLEPPVS